MEWSDAAVIGYNAGSDPYENHPLSGTIQSRLIGCVHLPNSTLNNVVYNLSDSQASGTTPEPVDTIGITIG